MRGNWFPLVAQTGQPACCFLGAQVVVVAVVVAAKTFTKQQVPPRLPSPLAAQRQNAHSRGRCAVTTGVAWLLGARAIHRRCCDLNEVCVKSSAPPCL